MKNEINDYTYSFYTKIETNIIKHPKWWAFWKQSKLVKSEKWVKKAVTIQDTEKGALMYFEHDRFIDIIRQLHNPINLQLEKSNPSTPYIPTNIDWDDTLLLEKPKTNFLKNSEL